MSVYAACFGHTLIDFDFQKNYSNGAFERVQEKLLRNLNM